MRGLILPQSCTAFQQAQVPLTLRAACNLVYLELTSSPFLSHHPLPFPRWLPPVLSGITCQRNSLHFLRILADKTKGGAGVGVGGGQPES